MENNRDIDRFMEKVSYANNGCWEWSAGKRGGGYGVFYLNRRLIAAHRVSLFLFKGLSFENKLDAMHSCDNPSCVNPDHLSYGTRTDNMRDASRKGRTVCVNDWKGQLNPKSKLSPEQVNEIVKSVLSGVTRKDAAKLFGVTSVRIGQIMKDAGFPSKLNAVEAARAARLAKTTCRLGHPLSGSNLRVNASGARVCKQCETLNRQARRARIKQNKLSFPRAKKDGGGWLEEEI